jgi:plastocyanin domain-containing protein
VENGGYSPDLLALPADQAVELHLVTQDTHSCSRAFVIPDLDVSELLPETGDVVVNLPPQAAGTMIQFMCSMGMYTGAFQFK